MPDGGFDAVVADPPWNVGKRYGAHDDGMPPGDYAEWLRVRLVECARVSRGAVVLLPGRRHIRAVPSWLSAAGLTRSATLWWRTGSTFPDPDLAVEWQPVVCARRHGGRGAGGRLVLGARHRDDFDDAERHPCPKPIALMRWIVERACPAARTVLDPFAGTGACLRAIVDSGRAAVGVELDERYCAIARRRLVAAP